jgi:predicted AlkP superfamily pyrophosphatase or phosphodiesterase
MMKGFLLRSFLPSMPTLRRVAALLLASLFAVPPALLAQEPATTIRHSTAAKLETLAPAPPSAYNAHPKLAILLVIDQFREDYLERYRADFKAHGFRLFLEKGAYFPDCYYDYANTKTAPGHSTIGTGAYSDGHGIANNDWWDLTRNQKRPVSSVEDERYALVGIPSTSTLASPPAGASPRNLRASTVGDELRLATSGQSKVFGISLKDRAAILPSGAAANAAYWIDPQSGAFITSTYYQAQLPDWAAAFNASGRAAQATQEAQAFVDTPIAASSSLTAAESAPKPSTNFYNFVGRSPAANSYELDFARSLITGEQLGKHPVTDLITISLSANDILGHAVGPDSPVEHAMVDSLDTDLDSFFTWLDKNVDGGLGNVWIAITADHGIAPLPSEAARLGMNAATINLKKLIANLNEAMNAKFSPGEKVNYLFDRQELPYLSLNQPNFDRAGINEQEAEDAVLSALQPAVDSLSAPSEPPAEQPAQPAASTSPDTSGNVSSGNVSNNEPPKDATKEAPKPPTPAPAQTRLPPTPVLVRAYSRQQLAAGSYPASEFGQILSHSYSSNGGWYVMAIFADYQMEASGSGGTTHFSPWSYDRHVPLGFYGAPFAPGIYHGRVGPVDLAATWAALLGINQPSASVGRILTQAIKPAATITYPKPPSLHPHQVRPERGKTVAPPSDNSATPDMAPSTSAPATQPPPTTPAPTVQPPPATPQPVPSPPAITPETAPPAPKSVPQP